MIEIIVIGTGNLGINLCKAIEKQDAKLKLVGYCNHSTTVMDAINAPLIASITDMPNTDLIIIATPDDVIPIVSELIKTDAVVAHTSGSVSIGVLSHHKNRGVFYIPQTFSKSRELDFGNLPICLEYTTDDSREVLEVVGNTLSRKRNHLNSTQRKQLHLAAVYINNFVNHCYTKADEILKKSQINAELLHPLMEETLSKAQELGAFTAQTGPARRNDQQTIQSHLSNINADDRAMYDAITQSIIKTYKNEL